MEVLEDINSMAMDINRDVQAMLFFIRNPPRINTSDKFVELAKAATANFRLIQAKTAEASTNYPMIDTSLMTVELTLEAIQTFLVTTIKKLRTTLNEWIESQETFAPGPSIEYIPAIAQEMSALVESVLNGTRSARRILSGEPLMPRKPSLTNDHLSGAEIDVMDALEVEHLVSVAGPSQIDSYLVPSKSVGSQEGAVATIATEADESASFESMLADYEREERREKKRAEKMAARQPRERKEVVVREGIEVNPEILDSLVYHLSELTNIFFYDENNYGEHPGDSNYVTMTELVANGEKATNATLLALQLQTSSIDMESLLNDVDQSHLAGLTSLHCRDIIQAMQQVLRDAPNVDWNILHKLDVSIKDFATTIKDIVQLAVPETMEVDVDEDGNIVTGQEEIEVRDDEIDEAPVIVKPTRLMTREEELLAALDSFSDALDGLEFTQPLNEGWRITQELKQPSRSHSLSQSRSEDSSVISASPSPRNNGRPSLRSAVGSVTGMSDSGAPLSSSSTYSTSSGGSYSSIDSQKLFMDSLSSPSSSSPNLMIPPTTMTEANFNRSVTVIMPRAAPAAKLTSSRSEDKSKTRTTSQTGKQTEPLNLQPSAVRVSSPSIATPPAQDQPKATRIALTANRAAGVPQADISAYEVSDEAVRYADPNKVLDRWSDMQARAEQRKSIPNTQDAAIDNDSSKVRSAFKVLSKKMGDMKKKAFDTRPNASPLSSSASSPSLSSSDKRRSVILNSSPSGSPPSSPSLSAASAASSSILLQGALANDQRRFLFEAPDDESVIRFSPDTQSVLGGTIEKLVQHLTHDSMPHPDFVLCFLTTYKCFITTNELLDLLCLRWECAAPSDVLQTYFETSRLPSIRLRVYNVLKTWIEKFWSDLNQPALIDRLKLFAEAMHKSGMSSASQTLLKLIQKAIANEGFVAKYEDPPPVLDFVRRSRKEKPILTPDETTLKSPAILNFSGDITSLSRPLSILDFNPLELARQISRMEFDLWKQVKNVELLETAWTRKDKETRAPNVLNMIRFSNHITNWMISEILAPEDPVERSVVLNRCMYITRALLIHHNFNGAMEALSAFNSSPIYRLRSTWNLLPSTTWSIYEELEKLMSPDANFKAYRTEYDRAVPPYAPYLGTHLSDLLFLEEKLPKIIPGTNLINFAKMEKMAQFIQTLELSQQVPYTFTPVPIIASYIKSYPILSEKDAYNLSLKYEARKAKNRPASSYYPSNPTSPSTRSTTIDPSADHN